MATKRKKKPAAEANGNDSMTQKTMVAFSLEGHLADLIDQKIAGIQKDLGINVPLSRASICKGIVENHFSK